MFADASEDYEGTRKYVVVKNKENIPFMAGLHTIIARSINDSIYDDFKRYCFSTYNIKRQFAIYANGISVYGISKSSIAKISSPLPPALNKLPSPISSPLQTMKLIYTKSSLGSLKNRKKL